MSSKTNAEHGAKAYPGAISLFRPSMKALMLNIDTFLIHAAALAGMVILFWLIGLAGGAGAAGALIFTIGVLAVAVLGVAFNATLTYTILRSSQQKRVTIRQVIPGALPYAIRLLGLTLLAGLAVIVGLILLIIPGLFAMQRLLLSPYFLIDKNMKVVEAIKASIQTAKKQPASGAVWGVIGVLIAISVIGFLPYLGGLINTVLAILFMCAPAVRYVQIEQKA